MRVEGAAVETESNQEPQAARAKAGGYRDRDVDHGL
jgi:hypothetical protein